MGELLNNIVEEIDFEMFCFLLGVVGGIIFFNFLMMVLFWMFFFVIVCGNVFVLKLFEWMLFLVMWFVEFFIEVGVLDGLLNIVYGVYDVVNGLIEYEKVKVILFVGL